MPPSVQANNLARAIDLTPAPWLPVAAPLFARPLRIALVTEYYYPHLGGICEHVHFFAQEARRLGHHVDIITSNLPGAIKEPHVIRIGTSQPVYFNGSQARLTVAFSLRKKLRETLRRGEYDVVHVHSPLSPSLPIMAIDEADCPVALVGNPEMIDAIRANDQQFSRIGIHGNYELEDSELHAASMHVATQFSDDATAETISDLIAFIAAKDGRLRAVRKTVILAQQLRAESAKLRDDPRAAIRAAHARLIRDYTLPTD